jgi:hypothetical protein
MMSLSGKAYQLAAAGSGSKVSLRKAAVNFICGGSLRRLPCYIVVSHVLEAELELSRKLDLSRASVFLRRVMRLSLVALLVEALAISSAVLLIIDMDSQALAQMNSP